MGGPADYVAPQERLVAAAERLSRSNDWQAMTQQQ